MKPERSLYADEWRRCQSGMRGCDNKDAIVEYGYDVAD